MMDCGSWMIVMVVRSGFGAYPGHSMLPGPDDGNVADDVGQRRQQVLAVYRGRQGN